jgi:hypothetical protein
VDGVRRPWILLPLLAVLVAAPAVPAEESQFPGEMAARAAPTPESGGLDLALKPGGLDPRVPWDRLDGTAYGLVRDVVDGALVAREVRDIGFRCRPGVFAYLLDHPDFAAEVARHLRQGRYRVRRVGDSFEADDGHGVRGSVRPLHADAGRRVFYVEGRYDVPLLPTLAGRLVVLLDTATLRGPDGVDYCDLHVAGFLKVDNAAAEVLAGIAQAFGEASVERRVRRFFRHVAVVSRRAYDDPEGLADELERRGDLSPERLSEFQRLLVGDLLPAWARAGGYRLMESAELEGGGGW